MDVRIQQCTYWFLDTPQGLFSSRPLPPSLGLETRPKYLQNGPVSKGTNPPFNVKTRRTSTLVPTKFSGWVSEGGRLRGTTLSRRLHPETHETYLIVQELV